jgi:hypothetical protein
MGIDIDAGLDFKLGATLDILTAQEKARQAQDALINDISIFRSFGQGGIATDALVVNGVTVTGALLTYDPVPEGYVMEFRHLTVSLPDPTDITTGAAWDVFLFRGGNPQDFSGTRYVAWTVGLPCEAIYPKHAVTAQPPEMMYILVLGLDAGVQVVGQLEGRLIPNKLFYGLGDY